MGEQVTAMGDPAVARQRAHPDAALALALLWSLRIAAIATALSIAVAQIAVGASVVFWLALRIRTGGPKWPRTKLDLPVAAFLAVGVFSALVGLDPLESLAGLHSYLWVVFFYAVVANVRDDRERRLLIGLLLAGLMVSSLHRLANHKLNDPTPNRMPYPWLMPGWFPGKMTRANQLLLGLPLAHALLLGARGWKARLGYGVATGVLGVGMVVTLKRAASVAAMVALGVQWWLKKRWMVAVLLALSLAVGFGYEPIRTRFEQIVYDFAENPDNRGHMWLIAWDLLKEHPLGIGTDNGDVMQAPRADGRQVPMHKHFHSNPINIAVENGWLGLAAWGWWMGLLGVLLVQRARAAREEGPFAQAVALGVLTGLIGWHLSGLTEFNFGDSEVMLVLYLLTGIALGMGPELLRDD